eukprot:gene187-225_t
MHTESGLRCIEESGLTDLFNKTISPNPESNAVVDMHGVVQIMVPVINFARFRPEIERGQLRDLYLDSLQDGTVKWNRHYSGMRQLEDGQIELSFKDGSKEMADILIGADGINSKIRPLITDIEPQYTGITMLTGEIDNPRQQIPEVLAWAETGQVFMLGESMTIMNHSNADHKMSVYFSFKADQSLLTSGQVDFSNPESAGEFLHDKYTNWAPVFHRLIDETVRNGMIPRHLSSLPIDQKWHSLQNVTLIGDAAHVFTPFAGEGANMAMLDAVVLADALTSTKHKTIQEAFKTYEKEMLERTSAAAKDTKGMEEMLHQPNAIDQLYGKIFWKFTFLRHYVPQIVGAINFVTGIYMYFFGSSNKKSQ